MFYKIRRYKKGYEFFFKKGGIYLFISALGSFFCWYSGISHTAFFGIMLLVVGFYGWMYNDE